MWRVLMLTAPCLIVDLDSLDLAPRSTVSIDVSLDAGLSSQDS